MIKRRNVRLVYLSLAVFVANALLSGLFENSYPVLLSILVFVACFLVILILMPQLRCPRCGSLAAVRSMSWCRDAPPSYCPHCGNKIIYDDTLK